MVARSLTLFRLPSDFYPLGADDRRVWGVVRDELDVERLATIQLPG